MCSSLSLPVKENSRLKLNMQLYLRTPPWVNFEASTVDSDEKWEREKKGDFFLNFLLFVLQEKREESLLIYPV